MPSENMVERAAKAVRDTIASFDNSDKDIARAVLQAIREPDDAMLQGACEKHRPGRPMHETTGVWPPGSEPRDEECPMFAKRRHIWLAMIDTALSTPDAHHD